MKSILNFFTTLFASLLAGLAVIVGVLIILSATLALTVLTPGYYKLVLNGTYEQLPKLIALQVTTMSDYKPEVAEPESASSPQSGAPAMFANLSKQNWEKLITLVAPSSWLKSQTESVLDQFSANIAHYPSPATPVTISIVDLKSRMTGETGVSVIQVLTESLEPCTRANEAYWMGLPGETKLTCRPSAQRFEADRQRTQAKLEEVFGGMPDNLVIEGLALDGDQLKPLHLARRLPLFVLLVELVLLGLIAALKVRSRRSLATWFGTPLLIIGILGLLLGLVIALLLPVVIVTLLTPKVPVYWSSEVIATVFGLGQKALRLLGAVAGILSSIPIAVSIYLKRKH